MSWSRWASKAIKEQNDGHSQNWPPRRVKDCSTSQQASSEPHRRDHPQAPADSGGLPAVGQAAPASKEIIKDSSSRNTPDIRQWKTDLL